MSIVQIPPEFQKNFYIFNIVGVLEKNEAAAKGNSAAAKSS
jgi:hypothetical protein